MEIEKENGVKDDILNIIDRLMQIAGVETDASLAIRLHTNKNTFSSWKRQNKTIPIDTLITFCEEFNASLDWILRGVVACYDKEVLHIPFVTDNYKKQLQLEYSKIKEGYAQKGIAIPPVSKSFKKEQLVAFINETDEMQKSCPMGSVLFMDKSTDTLFLNTGTFLVRTDSGVFLRLLVPTQKKDTYKLVAEHEEIEDWIMQKEEFTIIGKVIAVLHNMEV